ncbi:hypothetical protein LTR56_018449 [Elasticomyces elasticus]|nr:hypothetical protein LTR56_018449 [Elasticomyces elasticus]KAK4908393.1 hypothetical protein LTR49_022706 [Elasticomyces elasticus]KAK5751721.1 hypothetical protein LTS12_018196 [Elasticomyces elasticus]
MATKHPDLDCTFLNSGMQRHIEWTKPHEVELETVELKVLTNYLETAKTDPTLWFKRTEWSEHVAGYNLRHLSRISRSPDQEEHLLCWAVELNNALIEKCVAGLTSLVERCGDGHVAQSCPSPIKVRWRDLQNGASQQTCLTYMGRSLCFSLRVPQSCGDQEQQAETEEDTETNDESDGSDDGGSSDGSVDEENYSSEPVIDVFQDTRRLHPWHGPQKELLRVFQQSMEWEVG